MSKCVGASVHPCRRPFLTSKLSEREAPTLTSASMLSWKDFTILYKHPRGYITSLQHPPQSFPGHRVICFSQIYKKGKQVIFMFPCLLQQLPCHKYHVTAASSLPKTTLGFWQQTLSNHLQPLLDDPSEDFPYHIQQADATPVITVLKVSLLRYRYHHIILPICYYLPLPPHDLHQLQQPVPENCATKKYQLR